MTFDEAYEAACEVYSTGPCDCEVCGSNAELAPGQGNCVESVMSSLGVAT